MDDMQRLMEKYEIDKVPIDSPPPSQEEVQALMDKYGVTPVDPVAPKGVKGKIYNTLKAVNPYLQSAGDFAQQNITQPIQDFASGVGQGALNLPSNAFNAVVGLHNQIMPDENAWSAHAPTLDSAPHTAAATAGDIASLFTAPGIAGTGTELAAKIPGLVKGIQAIPGVTSGANKIGQLAEQYPRVTNLLKNASLGALYSSDNPLLGMSLGGFPSVLGATVRALRIPSWFAGPLSPEELQKNLASAEGTQTHLGDILQSPGIKKINENIIAKLPFTGAVDAMQGVAHKIKERGTQLIDKLRGDTPHEELSLLVGKALQRVGREQKNIKNQLYGDVNQLADEEGFKPDMTPLATALNNNKEAIDSMKLLTLNPSLNKMYRYLTSSQKAMGGQMNPSVEKSVQELEEAGVNEKYLQDIKSKSGTPEREISLKEANIHKGDLRRLAAQYKSSNDPSHQQVGRIYDELADAASKSIKDSLEKDGSEGLKNKYIEAESNYSKNYSPFLDSDVFPYLSHNHMDPDLLISHFIKGGINDRHTLLSKLMDLLPKNAQNAVGGAYLSRAMNEYGELNPLKLRNLLKSTTLGKKQFEALFPDAGLRKELLNHARLTDLNKEALTIMENPNTGQRNNNPLTLLASLAAAGGATMGHIGAAAVPAAAIAGGNITNRLLTSPLVRKGVVNGLIRGRKGKPGSKLANALIGAHVANQ